MSAAWPLQGAARAGLEQFDPLMQRLDAQDPNAPQALEMHLRYANYLATSQDGECAPRLRAAQDQLDGVQAKAAAGIVLLAGRAREADVSYLIHVARASCGPPTAREGEFRAALLAAQRSAELYRDVFDYVSMATMQYNIAVTYQSLGEQAQALAALDGVLATDREFGFRDDAAENTELLLRWSHLDVAAQQVDARMRDFPVRTTHLKFAWPSGESEFKLETDYARLIGEEVLRAHGERSVMRQVQKRAFHWVVSFQPLSSQYTLDQLPPAPGLESSFMRSLAGMLLQFHDQDLIDLRREDAGPGFSETLDRVSFINRVRREGDALLRDLAPPASRAAVLRASLEAVLKGALQGDSIERQAALDFNLEAGAWPGATLAQGVWYELKMPLPLPYAPMTLIDHKIEFTYARALPCTRDAEAPSCVEIVMRAVPAEADMKSLLREMRRGARLPRGSELESYSTTAMRLITDPETLTPYLRDIRRHAYLSADGTANGALLSAEKLVISRGHVKALPN